MPKKVLIIEDEQFLLDMYKLKFEHMGYEVVIAEDGEAGLVAMEKANPDIVLLDIIMPKLDGYQVLKQARSDPKLKNLKIYILSNLGQVEEVNRGISLGADGYLVKANLTPNELVDFVDRVLNNKEIKAIDEKTILPKNSKPQTKKIAGNNKKVLIIEDELAIIEMYRARLEKEGYNVTVAKNGAWGLKIAKENDFDLIILDMVMPAMHGCEMLKKLKAEEKRKQAPIIVLSNSAQDKDIDEAKSCGAASYIIKSQTTPTKIIKEIEKLLKK